MSQAIHNPAPQPKNPLDIEFWEHCNNGTLSFQRCSSCQTWRHLPRIMCANCGSTDWEWRSSAGRGELYSWTICYQAMSPEFKDAVPFAIVMVEMEEGVRVISSVKDMDFSEFALGLPVQATLEPLANGGKLLFFKPRK